MSHLARITTILALMATAALAGSGPDLGLDLAAGARSTWWFTGDDDDGEETVGNAIDYEADPAETWWADVGLRVAGVRALSFGVQRPFDDTPEQRRALEETDRRRTSLEQYLLVLDLLTLAEGDPGLWRRLLAGLRLDYRRSVFHGVGEAVEPSVWVDGSGAETVLPVGGRFGMKADFEDWYLSLVALRLGNRSVLRLGGYRSLVHKPHESIIEVPIDQLGRSTLIVDTRMEGWGVFGLLERPGLSCLLRLGAVEFSGPDPAPHPLLYANDGSFAALLDLHWTPSVRLAGGSDGASHRLVLQPRLGFLFRLDSLSSTTEGLYLEDSEDSVDLMLDLGLRLVWRWGS